MRTIQHWITYIMKMGRELQPVPQGWTHKTLSSIIENYVKK
jgi:hypothetical protein